MPTPLPALSRRALLGVSAGLVAVGTTGCSLDSLDPTSDDPTMTATGGSSSPDEAPPTSDDTPDDDQLVEDVLAAIALAHRTARGNARAHRDLAPTLRRFESLHVAHGDELGGMPAATGRVTGTRDSTAQAAARVDRAEARLQRTLVDAASGAGSGALAQTFASMAAAVAQLRTTLDVGAAS